VTYRYLEYWQVGLRDLEASAYAQAAPVLAAALSALMRPGPEGRAMLKFEMAQRIAASSLDGARTFLLLNVLETYLELDEAEYAEYQALLATEGGAEVEMTEMTWGDRKVLEGQRTMVRRAALTHLGTVPKQLEQYIAQADQEALERLLDRVVLGRDLQELLADL